MFFRIQDLNGHVFQVDIDENMEVGLLKKAINKRLGYRNDDYQIYHYNDHMEEEKRISEYNVAEGDTIALVLTNEIDNREHPRWVY